MTANRTHAAILIVVLAAWLAGCDEASSRSPTAPSTKAPTPTVTTPTTVGPWPSGTFVDVTFSGTVYEMTPTGRVPLEHVTLYCELCGADTHSWASTDSTGFYRFSGVWVDYRPMPVHVHKDGYADPAGVPRSTPPNPSGPGWREVLVTGDTRFDVELVRR
jgi:hypothetical protein